MPIDASAVESPGWWLQRLWKKLLDERDDSRDDDGEVTPGLTSLRKAAEGKPKLPHVPGVDPREIAEWMRDARTNWLSLVIDSPGERLGVDGDSITVETGPDSSAGEKHVKVWALEPITEYTPGRARELAEALLRAANEAESETSAEALLRMELDAMNAHTAG
ncbi:hypothetical protein ACFWMU_10640 [Streptomyces sp. NPDC058357]|uniref:hypothetical protein n=1 Tax=unclassified Streptomyces TaxID=2593676 RepID=UPI003653CF08